MTTTRDILGLTRSELTGHLARLNTKSTRANKGAYHADALFRDLYENARFAPEELPAFADNPALAARVRETFTFDLPEITDRQGDGDTYKFLLRLSASEASIAANDSSKFLESESVVIPMKHHKTLCVSSQVGCKMGCRFCETAQMGFLRNLTAGEIVAQVFVARQVLNEPIENIVFMGMGEPTDNLDAVMTAIRILSDQHGFGISLRSITVSTVGNIAGIQRLTAAAQIPGPEGGLRGLRLAVSLNAPEDAVRSDIMPINRTHDMAALRDAMLKWPLPRPGDFVLAEYVLIADVNDAPEHAHALAEFLRGTPTCVNLIPYNPRRTSAGETIPFRRPTPERVTEFFRLLQGLGQYCRIRGTKGDNAMAACGQLGNRALARRNRSPSGHVLPTS